MDKKFLEQHNLTEGQKRFQSILEYVQLGGMKDISEASPEDNEQMPPQGSPDAGAPMPGSADMGGTPMPGEPDSGAAPMPGAPQDGGPQNSVPGDDAGAAPQGVEGFQPQGGEPAPAVPEDDEEVIDVDELVDTQDETSAKVSKLSGKIDSLLQIIGKLESGLDQNSAHMEELKKEFDKRNPTQVEKMTLRAKQGYPFTQSPDEYWAGKEAEGNYSPEDDKDGVGDERYAITKNDVDNITDWDSIYKSIGNGTFHQDLKGILNF